MNNENKAKHKAFEVQIFTLDGGGENQGEKKGGGGGERERERERGMGPTSLRQSREVNPYAWCTIGNVRNSFIYSQHGFYGMKKTVTQRFF